MNKLSEWIKKSEKEVAPVTKKSKDSIFSSKKSKSTKSKKKQAPRPHDKKQASKLHTKKQPKGSYGSKGKLRIIPLGGLDEVGKNCTCIEYGRDVVVIDLGMQFPEEDMYGIDYLIPDTTYLENRKQRIRGILITHGHI
jgi:ribonuclease J